MSTHVQVSSLNRPSHNIHIFHFRRVLSNMATDCRHVDWVSSWQVEEVDTMSQQPLDHLLGKAAFQHTNTPQLDTNTPAHTRSQEHVQCVHNSVVTQEQQQTAFHYSPAGIYFSVSDNETVFLLLSLFFLQTFIFCLLFLIGIPTLQPYTHTHTVT